MSWKPTMILALLVLLLGGFILFVEPALRPKPVEPKMPTVIPSDDLANVVRIEIRRAGEQPIVCERIKERDRSEWLITAPIRVKASPVVESLPAIARQIPIRSTVNPKEMEPPEVYGFEAPRVVVELRTAATAFTLRFGNASKAAKDLVFLRKGESPEILLVDKHVFDQFNKGINDLRDRLVVNFETHAIERAVVAQKILREQKEEMEELELVRGSDGRWTMTRPLEIAVDMNQIIRFLQDMRNLHAEEFILAPTDLAEYGLDRPQLVVTLTPKGAEKPIVVQFGDPLKTDPKRMYVRDADAVEVVVISVERFDLIPREPSQFRTRIIFPYNMDDVVRLSLSSEHGTLKIESFEEEVEKIGKKVKETKWKVVAPENFKAMPGGAAAFLSNVLPIPIVSFVDRNPQRLDRYGLDVPSMVLRLTVKKRGKAKDETEKVEKIERVAYFGHKNEIGDGYGRIDGEDEVITIPGAAYDFLKLAEWNFRDNIFLEIPSDAIRELQVEILEWLEGANQPIRGGYVCRKDEKKTWAIVDPPSLQNAPIDEERLLDILARMNYFKVLRYVSRDEGNLDGLGLVRYAMKVTVLYDRKEGETTTSERVVLRIAKKVEDGLLHVAKFDHSPVVFTIDAPFVEFLRKGVRKQTAIPIPRDREH